MNNRISLAILVVGLVLVFYGISAANALSSGVSRAVTGSPADQTLWFFGGGGALILIGGYGLLMKSD